MEILFRTISSLTVNGMEARLTVCRHEGRLRVELEPYSAAVTTVYTSALQATVSYNGQTKTLSVSPFTKTAVAGFGFSGNVRQMTLTAQSIEYDGRTVSSQTFAWKGDGTVAAPVLSVAKYSGLLTGQSARIEWKIEGVPEGYTAYTVRIWQYYSTSNGLKPPYTRSVLLGERTTATACEHTVSGLAENHVLYYRIAVALYENASDAVGDYVAYAELDTPAYVCSGSSLYTLAPCNLRYPQTIIKGGEFQVKWDFLSVATLTKGAILQYCPNGGNSWYDVCTTYNKNTTSYPFTVTQNWTSIAFRVRAYSTRNIYEVSKFIYGPVVPLGKSNLYIGKNNIPVAASAMRVGGTPASVKVYVG